MTDCKHPSYQVKDGALVCTVCGEPSPKAKIVDHQIVKLEKEITCPHCGGRLTESGKPVEEKAAREHEDKAIRKRADKKR